jgi:hypothetical protein
MKGEPDEELVRELTTLVERWNRRQSQEAVDSAKTVSVEEISLLIDLYPCNVQYLARRAQVRQVFDQRSIFFTKKHCFDQNRITLSTDF